MTEILLLTGAVLGWLAITKSGYSQSVLQAEPKEIEDKVTNMSKGAEGSSPKRPSWMNKPFFNQAFASVPDQLQHPKVRQEMENSPNMFVNNIVALNTRDFGRATQAYDTLKPRDIHFAPKDVVMGNSVLAPNMPEFNAYGPPSMTGYISSRDKVGGDPNQSDMRGKLDGFQPAVKFSKTANGSPIMRQDSLGNAVAGTGGLFDTQTTSPEGYVPPPIRIPNPMDYSRGIQTYPGMVGYGMEEVPPPGKERAFSGIRQPPRNVDVAEHQSRVSIPETSPGSANQEIRTAKEALTSRWKQNNSLPPGKIQSSGPFVLEAMPRPPSIFDKMARKGIKPTIKIQSNVDITNEAASNSSLILPKYITTKKLPGPPPNSISSFVQADQFQTGTGYEMPVETARLGKSSGTGLMTKNSLVPDGSATLNLPPTGSNSISTNQLPNRAVSNPPNQVAGGNEDLGYLGKLNSQYILPNSHRSTKMPSFLSRLSAPSLPTGDVDTQGADIGRNVVEEKSRKWTRQNQQLNTVDTSLLAPFRNNPETQSLSTWNLQG